MYGRFTKITTALEYILIIHGRTVLIILNYINRIHLLWTSYSTSNQADQDIFIVIS